jgi:drug/metabolite transporter (DMT)-like permease
LSTSTSHLRAYLALGAGTLGLAFSALFVRWSDAPGIVTSFHGLAIAVVVLAWPACRQIRTNGGLPRQGLKLALLGGLFHTCDIALWSTGVVISGATNPTLLTNTAPLWVGLGALILFREKLGTKFWVGLLLAMAGAILILGLDSLRAVSFGVGTLLGLLAGIFYGGYFLITQRGRENLDALTYLWLAGVITTLGLLALSLMRRNSLTGYSASTYLNFLAMGLVTQVFGYLGVNYALGHLSASLVAPTMLGQPVLTAVLAWLLLGEAFSLWQVLGGAAVLTGVYVVHRSRQEDAALSLDPATE